MSVDNYEKVVKNLQEIKPENVVSYMIMVETNEQNDDSSHKGINAMEGNGPNLANLVANIDPEILILFLMAKILKGHKDE